MADLAARLEVVPRSVTTMVDSLERARLVARHADRDDRRSVLVTPTAEGRRLIDRLDRAGQEGAVEVFGGLSTAEREHLLALLGALCERGSCVSCCGAPAAAENGRRASAPTAEPRGGAS
jgi:DNA-binding MarR family transcriptional regulator